MTQFCQLYRSRVRLYIVSLQLNNNLASTFLRGLFYVLVPVLIYHADYIFMPIPVVARSKEWVCCRSITGIVGSNPPGALLSLVNVACGQVFATGRSLVQRSPVEYGCLSLNVIRCNINPLHQCFSTARTRPGTGPWHQLYRAAKGSPGICHFSFLSNFHE